jgi:hypothetical protein
MEETAQIRMEKEEPSGFHSQDGFRGCKAGGHLHLPRTQVSWSAGIDADGRIMLIFHAWNWCKDGS